MKYDGIDSRFGKIRSRSVARKPRMRQLEAPPLRRARGTWRSAAVLAVGPTREVDAELLELAIEVGTLEAGLLCHPGHAAMLA